MKKNDIKKLLGKSADELMKDVAQAKEKMADLKRDILSGKVKNSHAYISARRDVARMLTAIKNKNTTK